MNPHVKEAWFVHYLEEKDYVGDEFGMTLDCGWRLEA